MNKLTTFFRSFFRSLVEPRYYNDILKAPTSFSWKYFFFLQFLLAILFVIQLIPPVMSFQPEQFADQVAEVYPADLELDLNRGRLSINQPLPYRVNLPASMTDGSEMAPQFDMSLVTFTTDDEFSSLQQFDSYNSLVVVTETALYAKKDAETSEIRAYPFPTDENIRIDSTIVRQGLHKVTELPFIKNKWYVPAIAIAAFVILLPLTTVWRLATLVFYSLVVWILSQLFFKSKNISFEQWFRLGLHALTLPVMLAIVTDWLGYDIWHGGVFVLSYVVWAMIIASALETNHDTVATSSKTKRTTTKKRKV